MFEVNAYPHGIFCWSDVNTTDTAAGKAFYSGLFGWTYEDNPTGQEGVYYTMFSLDGRPVAALSPMQPEMAAQGMPAVWNSYISVDDVDAVASRVAELGGKVMMPPFDVMDAGRMAMIQDPSGALVLLWQAGAHIGAGVINKPGAMIWNELNTRDPLTVAAFYQALLGWEIEKDPNMEYWYIKNNGRFSGGIMQMTEEWGDLPAHWMVYFNIADVDKATAYVEEAGGSVRVPAFDTQVGRMAVVADPQGGVFSIMTAEEPDPAW